jgi:hypothetical protein
MGKIYVLIKIIDRMIYSCFLATCIGDNNKYKKVPINENNKG